MISYRLYAWILSCAATFGAGWYTSGGRLSHLEGLVQDMKFRSEQIITTLGKAPTIDVYCTQKTNSLVDRECNLVIEQGDNKYKYIFRPYRLGTSRNNTLRLIDERATKDESSSVVTLLD